jgi:hypothetical protein
MSADRPNLQRLATTLLLGGMCGLLWADECKVWAFKKPKSAVTISISDELLSWTGGTEEQCRALRDRTEAALKQLMGTRNAVRCRLGTALLPSSNPACDFRSKHGRVPPPILQTARAHKSLTIRRHSKDTTVSTIRPTLGALDSIIIVMFLAFKWAFGLSSRLVKIVGRVGIGLPVLCEYLQFFRS